MISQLITVSILIGNPTNDELTQFSRFTTIHIQIILKIETDLKLEF